MAKITTSALLNVGTELTINEAARTFDFNVAGNIVAKDGVDGPALWSKFNALWATLTYQDSPFPMYLIDAMSGQYKIGFDGYNYNGWKPGTDATRNMLRDMGWTEYNVDGTIARIYVSIYGDGIVSNGAQIYYQRLASEAAINFPFTDQVNAAVQVYGDAANGNFDLRNYFKVFCREQGYKFTEYDLTRTKVSNTGPYIVSMSISNEIDYKITANDAAMVLPPYDDVTVSYYTANQMRTINGVSYPFKKIIAGNGLSLEQIMTKAHYLLRQNVNINFAGTAGAVNGKTASDLLYYLGSEFETTQSVYIDNLSPADSNRVKFKDDNGVFRENIYTGSGVIEVNSIMVGSSSRLTMFFKAPPGAGNDFGETAVVVNDASGNPITFEIGALSTSFTYDYDGNVQAGFTAGTDRDVVLVGIRNGHSKYAFSEGKLQRSKTMKFVLSAETNPTTV